MYLQDIKNATTEQLIEAYKNAVTTRAQCGGHHKAEMNSRFSYEYQAELNIRQVDIPIDKICHEEGIFNGTGAY